MLYDIVFQLLYYIKTFIISFHKHSEYANNLNSIYVARYNLFQLYILCQIILAVLLSAFKLIYSDECQEIFNFFLYILSQSWLVFFSSSILNLACREICNLRRSMSSCGLMKAVDRVRDFIWYILLVFVANVIGYIMNDLVLIAFCVEHLLNICKV